jgi:hypothetical protein
MKRIFILLVLIAWGCAGENDVDPAKSGTFVRYFNGAFNDEAHALLQASDFGITILANTNFAGSPSDPSNFRINLIKTDEFGNLLWQKFFPEAINPTVSYKGYAIAVTAAGGYVIVGQTIQGASSKLVIITTDADGNNATTKAMNTLSDRKGISVTTTPTGNILVVSSIPNQPSVNLLLSEYTAANLDSVWTRQYGAGALVDNNLPNRLFTDGQGNAYWGGTVKKADEKNSMRFIKAPPNSQNVFFDMTLGVPSDIETSGDMIRYGNGFAFIGTSTLPDNSTSISVRRVTEGGTQLFSQSYKSDLLTSTDPLTGEITGNSLAVAQDGGLVLLGTVAASTSSNYCVLKIDGFGNPTPTWTTVLGGRFDDEGKAIITTRDGGHVVLGTTNLANVKTLLLLKVDKNGKIE